MDSMIVSLNDEMASKVSFSSGCRCHAESRGLGKYWVLNGGPCGSTPHGFQSLVVIPAQRQPHKGIC